MEEKREQSSKVQAQQVFSFAKKHALVLTLLLVVLLQFVPNEGGVYPWGGIWMRMQTQDLRMADRAAESSLDQFVQQQAAVAAQQQYPNLPSQNRQKVIKDLMEKFKEENKEVLKEQKEQLAREVRAHYQYEANGETFVYMPDIDPYHYLRYARNLVENGHVYDVMKNGVTWDDHRLAPLGRPADRSWHPYTLAFLYNMHSVLNPNVTLMQAAAYFPIVFMLLSIILAFFIAQRMVGNLGGFFAATVLALLPAIMSRTPWGHADTDVYNIFFPLVAVWLFVEALRARTVKKQLLFAGLCGASIGIYANYWTGWWYLFDLIAGALGVAVIVELVLHYKLLKQGLREVWEKTRLKKFMSIGVIWFVVSMVVGALTVGLRKFMYGAFFAGVSHTTIKEAANDNLWPNVLTTVAELSPANFNNVVASVGGMLLFVIAVAGIVFLLLRKNAQGSRNIAMGALLALWFVGTIYMSFKGTRFIMLIGPAFAVAFGVAAGLLTQIASRFGQRQFHVKKAVTTGIMILVLLVVIVNPAKGTNMAEASFKSVRNDVPIVNDAWWDSLTKIKDESAKNAIINSWWDFGHHFKYIADRAVTFDGGSQNSPQAHWIGRALQTDNEREAVGILRMLGCGANTAYNLAFEEMKDPLRAEKFVKKIILLDREAAIQLADEAGLSEVVQYTHCEPPENYVIASGDMIGKAGVWSHFGLWDFEKAEVWKRWRKVPASEAVPQMAERFNMSEEKAQRLYDQASALSSEKAANQWISPWIGYITQGAADCKNGDVLKCGSRIEIDLDAQTASVRLNQGIAQAGQVIVYGTDGSKNVLEAKEGNPELSIVVWPRSSTAFRAIASYSQLADSMFTRLYFMDGLGLEYFEPFVSKDQLIGGSVNVYKVDWAGSDAFVPGKLQPKEQVEQGARVALNYLGWTEEGAVFDSSIVDWKELNVTPSASFDAYNTTPLQIVYGKSQLIPGFTKGIEGMKPGETKTLTIPPEEAYGTDPTKHKLGNKTLKFKVTVIAVE